MFVCVGFRALVWLLVCWCNCLCGVFIWLVIGCLVTMLIVLVLCASLFLVGLIGFRVWLNGYLVRLGLFVCCLWGITFGFGLRFALLAPARYFLL